MAKRKDKKKSFYKKPEWIIPIVFSIILAFVFSGNYYYNNNIKVNIQDSNLDKNSIIVDSSNSNIDNSIININGINLNEKERPWLSINIVKPHQNKTYYTVIRENEFIYFNYAFRIKNIGEIPAKNIRFPNIINFKDNATLDKDVQLDLPSDFILFPEEEYEIDIKFGGIFRNISVEEKLKEYDNKDVTTLLKIAVNYGDINHNDTPYKTKMNFKISKYLVDTIGNDELY